MSVHDVNELVTLTATFAGDPIALGDVTVTVRAPSGEVTTPDPAEGAADNEFTALVTPDEPGDWAYRFAVTDGPAEEDFFTVRASQVVANLVHPFTTVERCRSELRIAKGVSTERLQAAINAYTRAIANYTGRELLPLTPALDEEGADTADPVEREFLYDGSGYLNLEPYEAREITGLSLRQGLLSQAVTLTDVMLGPPGRSPEGTYFWLDLPDWCGNGIHLPSANLSQRFLRNRGLVLVVEGRWGVGFVPEDVRAACEIAVANRYRNPEGMARRALGEGDFSPWTPDLAESGLGMSLPPDARALLGPYRRPRARMRRPTVTSA